MKGEPWPPWCECDNDGCTEELPIGAWEDRGPSRAVVKPGHQGPRDHVIADRVDWVVVMTREGVAG